MDRKNSEEDLTNLSIDTNSQLNIVTRQKVFSHQQYTDVGLGSTIDSEFSIIPL
jgi:hypothetical protein